MRIKIVDLGLHQVRNDGEGERIGLVRGERAPGEIRLVIGMRRGKVIRYEANGDTWSFSTWKSWPK